MAKPDYLQIARKEQLHHVNQPPGSLKSSQDAGSAVEWHAGKKPPVSFDTKTKLLREAIRHEPDRVELKRELARVYYHMGDHDAVARLFEEQSDDAAIIHIAGTSVMAQGDLKKAIKLLKKACEFDYFPARADLAEALDQSGQHDEAIEICDDLLKFNSNDRLALRIIGNGLLREGDGAALRRLCDQFADRVEQKTLLGTFRTAADVLLGEVGDKQLETAFRRDIAISSVEPEGWIGEKAQTALIAELEGHPNRMGVAYRQSTRDGTRVSDLLAHPSPCIAALATEFRRHIEQYLAAHGEMFSLSKTANANPKLKLSIWAVLLDKGGFQEWHMHPDALVSGVYYVAAPDIGNAQDGHSGWLEFGTANNIHDRSRTWTYPVEPVEGSLILFPSSYLHRTRAHKGQSPRISIAFDVIPINEI